MEPVLQVKVIRLVGRGVIVHSVLDWPRLPKVKPLKKECFSRWRALPCVLYM